jgi:photosystem II PsbY protein
MRTGIQKRVKQENFDMDFDFRLLIVLLPLLLAGGWALTRISGAALKQIEGFMNK